MRQGLKAIALKGRPFRVGTLLPGLTLVLVCVGTSCTPGTSVSSGNSPDRVASSPTTVASMEPEQSQVAVASPVTPQPKPTLDPYEQALDRAASASSIAESAQSADDWNLVVRQWQKAIALLQSVPPTSPQRPQAKAKLSDYQHQLRLAKQRSQVIGSTLTPNGESPIPVDLVPNSAPAIEAAKPVPIVPGQVYQARIKRRAGGTPVIAVTFNGQQTFDMIVDTGASSTVITRAMAKSLGIEPSSSAMVDTASQKGVKIPIGFVNQVEVNGLVVRNLDVAIAGSELETGLLGHNFFENFDLTFKRDIVEFHAR